MSLYPHDQPFIDSLHSSASNPEQVRNAVHSYLLSSPTTQNPVPSQRRQGQLNAQSPMVFIRWALPCFYAHTKKTGDFALIDAVVKGLVDGINSLPEETSKAAGELLAACARNQKDSLFDVYVSDEDQHRLAGILSGMKLPALGRFTSGVLKKDRPLSSSLQQVPSGFHLACLLTSLAPDLVPHICLNDLFTGMRYVFGTQPRENQAASTIAKRVLRYHLDPKNQSGFRLHLASAPKSDLAVLSWGICSLVDNVDWQPEDIAQLGDKRGLRYLEKAITRAMKVDPTHLTPMPSSQRLRQVSSIVRNATLSCQAQDKPRPSAPRM